MGDNDIIRILIKAGAEVNHAKMGGMTPLLLNLNKLGHWGCTEAVIEAGASVSDGGCASHPCFPVMGGMWTAPGVILPCIHSAITHGMEHLVPLLSSYGAPRVVERHVMMQGRSFYQPFPEGHVLEGDGCMAFTPQGSSSLVPLAAEALCGAAEGSEYVHPSVPKGSDRLLSWLEESRDWTPLHHIEALSKTGARARC